MPPASSSFMPLNTAHDVVPQCMDSFTMVAPPNTDLWRKPPSQDTSTAPILYTALRDPFRSAEVTVSADWKIEWDQGGLVIFAGSPPGRMTTPAPDLEPPSVISLSLDDDSDDPTNSQSQSRGRRTPPPPYFQPVPPAKWVKVGLEFSNNACHATSVVATSEGADWALSPLSSHHANRSDLRVKLERIGYGLWLWYEDGPHGWKKLREVTWFFWGVEDKAVRVGVYASRPANFGFSMYDQSNGANAFGNRNLCVGFEGLEIF